MASIFDVFGNGGRGQGMFPDPNAAQPQQGGFKGMLGGVRKAIIDPTFLAGAGLATGGGWGGAMQGARLGQGIQEGDREEAERQQFAKSWKPLMGQITDPKLRAIADAMPANGQSMDWLSATVAKQQAEAADAARRERDYERGAEERGLKLDLTRSQIRENDAQSAERSAKAGAKPAMEARLRDLGIEEGSPEWDIAMINGKLPAAAYAQANTLRQRKLSGEKIQGGLHNLAEFANTYDDASFTNALGPIQADGPGIISGPLGWATRAAGEGLNVLEGGQYSPSEVRDTIKSAADTLSTAIKPLIRGPGEGPWTDADQAQLNRIVGNLEMSRDKPEFRRRLNSVRDTLKANYGLDINFDAEKLDRGPLPGTSAPATGAAASAAAAGRGGNPAGKPATYYKSKYGF